MVMLIQGDKSVAVYTATKGVEKDDLSHHEVVMPSSKA